MLTILTAISNNKPLLSYISGNDSSGNKIDQAVRLYHQGTGLTISSVRNNIEYIKSLFKSNEVVCNDFKSHIKAFDLSEHNAYDCGIGTIDHCTSIVDTLKKIKSIKVPSKAIWMKLRADASVVYNYIENRGYDYFGQIVHPNFTLDTFSGRTRSTGFSIHNKNATDDIKSVDKEKNVFVHFDWVAADIRFGAILSGDAELNSVYEESDPYTYITDNIGDIDREEIKVAFLKALYNVEYDDPIFGLYQDFAKWLRIQHDNVDNNKPVYNIVGRPFYKDDNHNNKSVVNAILQGSVAAAIQAALIKIHKLDNNIIMTDIYDSIVCACNKSVVKDVINEVGKIMYRPFDGILDYDIKLPYRTNIGTKWCQWKNLTITR